MRTRSFWSVIGMNCKPVTDSSEYRVKSLKKKGFSSTLHTVFSSLEPSTRNQTAISSMLRVPHASGGCTAFVLFLARPHRLRPDNHSPASTPPLNQVHEAPGWGTDNPMAGRLAVDLDYFFLRLFFISWMPLSLGTPRTNLGLTGGQTAPENIAPEIKQVRKLLPHDKMVINGWNLIIRKG